MQVNIFLLCFNEQVLLPRVIKHYKTNLPNCKITVYDNESTDNSVKIATDLGCQVISFGSNGMNKMEELMKIKNHAWKSINSGWIIMADMDEFLCVKEQDLVDEQSKGTNVLNVLGYEMIGESQCKYLCDIHDLHDIKKYVINHGESKTLCFLRDEIDEMNYSFGAHKCYPTLKNDGKLKYSEQTYINKHMSILGLTFFINKNIERYKRSEKNRSKGMSTHYMNKERDISHRYYYYLKNCKTLSS